MSLIKKLIRKISPFFRIVNLIVFFISSQIIQIVAFFESLIIFVTFFKSKNKHIKEKAKQRNALLRVLFYSIFLGDKIVRFILSNRPSELSSTTTKSKFEHLYECFFEKEPRHSPSKFKFEILAAECINEFIRILNDKTLSTIKLLKVVQVDYDVPDDKMIKEYNLILDQNNIKHFHLFCLIDKVETILYVDGNEIFFHVQESFEIEKVINYLKTNLIKKVLDRKNSRDNYFVLKGTEELKEYPRHEVLEIINQFEIDYLINTIMKVLENGRKQGCVLVGPPGTGKSLAIKKIEEVLKCYPVLYLQPHHFSDSLMISKVFEIIRLLQPVFIVMEDLDSYDFKSKNPAVGAFINEIDDVNNNLNVFIMATVNSTKNVDRTIIDRPGRFDYLVEIGPPKEPIQVYQVIRSKFDSLKRKYKKSNIELPPFDAIDRKKLDEICENRLTQAHISYLIVERMLLENSEINAEVINRSLSKAVKDYQKQQEIIRRYE